MKQVIEGLLAFLIIAGIFGCATQDVTTGSTGPTVTLSPSSGAFGLSQMKGLAKKQAVTGIRDAGNAQFNLGKIKASTGFYFLLYNVGAAPITQIALDIDNEAFSVFPATIDSLLPGGDVGMLPIVKVSAYHGTPFDGVGNRPLLPKGDNPFTLSISGHSKTADGQDTVIELDAFMELEALVFDYTFEAASGIQHSGGSIGDFSNYPDITGKQWDGIRPECSEDEVITFSNTGSEQFRVRVFKPLAPSATGIYEMVLYLDTLLAVAASIDLPIEGDGKSREVSYNLVIYGNNTIADPAKIKLDDDGNSYMSISPAYFSCADIELDKKFDAFVAEYRDDNLYQILTILDEMYFLKITRTMEEPFIYQHYIYDLNTKEVLCSLTSNGSEITDICSDSTFSAILTTIQDALMKEYDNPSYELTMNSFGLGSGRTSRLSMFWPEK